ncbi:hypothetical protein [Streptomyces sp. NPDC089795]|uniref:hypothetical protein n=1 Tax=Streptomyces sp. NPDC089795 TaxID=3155297 RepID=UPI003438128D
MTQYLIVHQFPFWVSYIKHATVVRKAGRESTAYPKAVQDVSVPKAALMELDQAAPRATAVASARVTTWITLRNHDGQ